MNESNFKKFITDITNPTVNLKFLIDSVRNFLTLGVILGYAIFIKQKVSEDLARAALLITTIIIPIMALANLIQLLNGLLNLFGRTFPCNKTVRLLYLLLALTLALALTFVSFATIAFGISNGLNEFRVK